MNEPSLWTARWTTKLLNFLFWIGLRGAWRGCRNLLRTSARKGATGTEQWIHTVRQLAAAAGDGSLGSAGSPGQLETSLNSGYTVGPCNSYLEGPTLICLGLLLAQFVWACCSRNRAWDPPPSSSLAEERTPLLAPPPCGGARFADARSPRDPSDRAAITDARSPRDHSVSDRRRDSDAQLRADLCFRTSLSPAVSSISPGG